MSILVYYLFYVFIFDEFNYGIAFISTIGLIHCALLVIVVHMIAASISAAAHEPYEYIYSMLFVAKLPENVRQLVSQYTR